MKIMFSGIYYNFSILLILVLNTCFISFALGDISDSRQKAQDIFDSQTT